MRIGIAADHGGFELKVSMTCFSLGVGPDVPKRPFQGDRTVRAPSCENCGAGKEGNRIMKDNSWKILRMLGQSSYA